MDKTWRWQQRQLINGVTILIRRFMSQFESENDGVSLNTRLSSSRLLNVGLEPSNVENSSNVPSKDSRRRELPEEPEKEDRRFRKSGYDRE